MEEFGNHLVEALVKSVKIPFSITDTSYNFVFVNPAFSDITGFSEKELVGNSISMLLSGEMFEKVVSCGEMEGDYVITNWILFAKDGAKLSTSVESREIIQNGKKFYTNFVLNITRAEEAESELSVVKDLIHQTEIFSKMGSFEFNPETWEIHWSDGMYDMFGIERNQPPPSVEVQATWGRKEDIDRYKAVIRNCLETGEDFFIELELDTPGNGKRIFKNFGRQVPGKENWIYGKAIDITEEKKAAARMRESEKKYRQLTESLPSIVWTSDADGYLNYLNEYGLSYFGTDTGNLDKWRWRNYIHPDDIDLANKVWEEGKNNENDITALNRLKNNSGDYQWFNILIIPQKDENGELKGWTGIAADVHQRVETENELMLSNNRLRSLIDASPVAIYSITIDGIVQDFWNPAAEKLMGWKRKEVIGKFLPHVQEKHREEFIEMVRETKKRGTLNRTITRTNKSGDEVIIDVTGGCIYDENGEVSEILVTAMDMTEIEKNRKKIQQSLEEKETLLQEIHHRVKNNLAIVVSLLQLQVYRSDNENEKYRLTEAQNRVHSIAMVHELLYESEELNEVNLEKYYQKLITTIRNNMMISDIDIRLELEVNTAALNINQAIPLGLLINELATNSFKYAFNTTQKDNLIALKISREKNEINVSYSDNGSGFDMSGETFQAGLGMKIIDSLLEQLGAEYSISTTNGFSLDLTFTEKAKGPLARSSA